MSERIWTSTSVPPARNLICPADFAAIVDASEKLDGV